jgi:hypothetical protein
MMDLRDCRRLQQDVGDASDGERRRPHRRLLPTLHVPFYVAVVPSMPTPAGSALESLPRLLKTAVALHLKVER